MVLGVCGCVDGRYHDTGGGGGGLAGRAGGGLPTRSRNRGFVTRCEPQVAAAFVTFNDYQSMQRCVDDYDGSDSWFRYRFQPTPLQYKGKQRLIVTPAPEPSDILWENIEVCCEFLRVRGVGRVNVLFLL